MQKDSELPVSSAQQRSRMVSGQYGPYASQQVYCQFPGALASIFILKNSKTHAPRNSLLLQQL
jgi:hypothetical protein